MINPSNRRRRGCVRGAARKGEKICLGYCCIHRDHADLTYTMTDYVLEITARKSCKYGKQVMFEHLLFLSIYKFVFLLSSIPEMHQTCCWDVKQPTNNNITLRSSKMFFSTCHKSFNVLMNLFMEKSKA